MNKKSLHITYIDLAKAYDFVEYWAINDTLKHLGFNTKFINIINEMCHM